MYNNRRFQNKVTAGHFTLPAAIFISILCWMLAALLLPDDNSGRNTVSLWNAFGPLDLPVWADRLSSFLLYGIIGYFLIELNNTFAIIRLRASVQTTLYFLLITACPSMHRLYAGDVAAAMFLIALFFLFRSYQKPHASADLFHCFVFIGLGSLLWPQLTLFAPVFWIGARNFRSLHPKSFFASLVGWSLPYWFLLGHAFYHGDMALFYRPFQELATFQPVRFDFQPWELATVGYLFILFAASAGHCLALGYEDKIRTRSYLHFLMLLCFCMFLYIVLQPAQCIHLLSLLLIGTSILAGHLFALTHSRSSNIFFICSLVLLFLLFIFNVWTLL